MQHAYVTSFIARSFITTAFMTMYFSYYAPAPNRRGALSVLSDVCLSRRPYIGSKSRTEAFCGK